MLIGWLILGQTDYFKIKTVTFNGKELNYRQKWILLKNEYNLNLTDIDTNKLKEKLKDLYSTDSIQITKKYPDTLNIEIIDSHFIAFIKIFDPARENSTIFGMNEKGQIVSEWTVQRQNIYPLIEVKHPFLVDRWRMGQLKVGSEVEDQSLLTTIRSLAIIKVVDGSFFNRIHSIHIAKDQKKNYLKLHQIQTQFYFGETLTLLKLIKVDSLLEDLATRINFKTIDLRFDDVVGRN